MPTIEISTCQTPVTIGKYNNFTDLVSKFGKKIKSIIG